MDITFQQATTPEYSWQLIHTNMQPYYRLRGYRWDKEGFVEHWHKFINVEVCYGEARVGIMRLAEKGQMMHVYTLQIEDGWQGRGIGWRCLSYARDYAQKRCSRGVSLSVFAENPASGLYRRFGFVETGEKDDIIEMVYDLTADQW